MILLLTADIYATSIGEALFKDKAPPLPFEIRSDVHGWTNNNTPILRFKAIDLGSGIDSYRYQVNDGEWKTCESPLKTEALEDGVHTVRIRAYDGCKNYREESIRLFIDCTNPEKPEYLRTVSEDILERFITLKWFQKDDKEQYCSFKIERTPSWPGGAKYLYDSGYGEKSFTDYLVKNGSEYTYTVTAIDRAANESSRSVTARALRGYSESFVNKTGPTVTEYDGLSITFPEDSLPQDIIKIKVEKLSSEKYKDALSRRCAPVYSITCVRKLSDGQLEEVNHVELKNKATVEIGYNSLLIPRSYTEENLKSVYYDELWGEWHETEECYLDRSKRTVVFPVNHLTDFSVEATKNTFLQKQSFVERHTAWKAQQPGKMSLKYHQKTEMYL